jgi:hypothetical protein
MLSKLIHKEAFMPFTGRQSRAIQYIALKNNWKISLSSRPVVFFVDQHGKTVKRDIIDVLAEYDSGRKEDALSKKRNQNAGIGVRRYFS